MSRCTSVLASACEQNAKEWNQPLDLWRREADFLPFLSLPSSVLFTWWIYNDVTSMIIKRGRKRLHQTVCEDTVSTWCCHTFFPFHLLLRLSPLVEFSLHECLYRRFQSPLKQTSVGSLSNSTGLLHHNRPPAVIVDILPATTLRGEEVQSNRAARVPLWHIEPS